MATEAFVIEELRFGEHDSASSPAWAVVTGLWRAVYAGDCGVTMMQDYCDYEAEDQGPLTYWVARDRASGEPAGTVRLRTTPTYCVERMAVRRCYGSVGLGAMLLNALEQRAQALAGGKLERLEIVRCGRRTS